MFKTYIKITYRNLRKQKVFSLLSIASLALGLAVFMIGVLYVNFILNFDTFHQDAERIYGVVQVQQSSEKTRIHSAILPPPLISVLMREIQEIEEATGFYRPDKMVIQYQERVFYENNILYADSNFFSFFTFKIIEGNRENVLAEPYSIVLTQNAAYKYFGNENPVGNIVTLNNKIDVCITGIVEDVPSNSSIQFDFLISLETARALYGWMDDWTVNRYAVFVKLPEGYDPLHLENSFSTIIKQYFPETSESPQRLYLFQFLYFHLKSRGITSYLLWNPPGELYSSLFGAGLFLLIVCLNFVNLSTSRSLKRAREVGVRKVVGAERKQLVKQFLGESMIQALIAFPLAIIFFQLLCPAFLRLFGNPYNISLWNSPYPLFFFLGSTLIVGAVSGFYPAFLLSGFKPVHILKGDGISKNTGAISRKLLVVSQFTLSLISIISTMVLRKQFTYLVNLDLGYTKENVIVLPMTDNVRPQYKILKNSFFNHPNITHVSASAHLPFMWKSRIQVIPENMPERESLSMNGYAVDESFVETLDIKIIKGESFHRFRNNEDCIVNETAIKRLGWDHPLGNILTIGNQKRTVVGVAKDFHFRSLFNPLAPAVLYRDPDKLNIMYVKFYASSQSAIIEFIRKQWKNLVPDHPFSYSLPDHSFEEAYGDISRSASVGTFMYIAATLLSCLGLLGLANHTLARRTKEIGIRKILGATATQLFSMLTKEFLFLVLIANVIGWPIGYLIIQNILKSGYAYRTEIGILIFIISGAITFAATMLAIFRQTLKTVRTNPVDSLKYE